VHEFDWFSPAAVSKHHSRGAVLLLQVEGYLGADPLLGPVHALPFDALAGNELHDLHVIEAVLAKPELVDGPNHG
jgi:hypothetical protein